MTLHTSDLCAFQDCDRRVGTRGWCRYHYRQHCQGGPLKPLRIYHNYELNALTQTKYCCTCRLKKDYSEFSKLRSTPDGLSKRCISCCSSASKKLHARLIEESIEYREQKRLNTQLWRENNREKSREISKSWRANNLELSDSYGRNRRARKASAPGNATAKQVADRMAYYGWKCIYCGAAYEHVEHFFPLRTGGTNFASNLVPSCAQCNNKKAIKNPWQFISNRTGV